MIAATAGGMFTGLIEESTIKWLAIFGFFMNAFLVSIGNRNTTAEKVAEAKIEVARAMETAIVATPPTPTKQRGFARLGVLLLFAVLSFASLSFVSGCQHTREAYAVASQSDDRLNNTVYVVTEHYAAVVHEAADLREKPGTPQEVIDNLREM